MPSEFEQLSTALLRFQERAKAIAGAGVDAGRREAESAIKAAAPGGVAKEISSRRLRNDGPIVGAIVGIGVARGSRVKKPHGKFLALGSAVRYRRTVGGFYGRNLRAPTKQQLSTGAITPNHFVRDSFLADLSTIEDRMKQGLAEMFEREAARAKQ